MADYQDQVVFLSGAFVGIGFIVAVALSIVALRAGLRGWRPWTRKP